MKTQFPETVISEPPAAEKYVAQASQDNSLPQLDEEKEDLNGNTRQVKSQEFQLEAKSQQQESQPNFVKSEVGKQLT